MHRFFLMIFPVTFFSSLALAEPYFDCRWEKTSRGQSKLIKEFVLNASSSTEESIRSEALVIEIKSGGVVYSRVDSYSMNRAVFSGIGKMRDKKTSFRVVMKNKELSNTFFSVFCSPQRPR